jgi:hypothetical protein
VQGGWCPGGSEVLWVPGRKGCYVTVRPNRCGRNDRREVARPYASGCHTVQRNTGRCDGPYDFVWVPLLGGCRWTVRGRCPGGSDIVYVT